MQYHVYSIIMMFGSSSTVVVILRLQEPLALRGVLNTFCRGTTFINNGKAQITVQIKSWNEILYLL